MHDAVTRQMLDRPEHAPHIVLDLGRRHISEERLERLALLVAEHKRHLAIEPIGLNQLSDVIFALQVLQDEHLYQNKRGVDGREDSLDGVLPDLTVCVCIV